MLIDLLRIKTQKMLLDKMKTKKCANQQSQIEIKKLLRESIKIIQPFSSLGIILNSGEFDSVNLLFQDENRYA